MTVHGNNAALAQEDTRHHNAVTHHKLALQQRIQILQLDRAPGNVLQLDLAGSALRHSTTTRPTGFGALTPGLSRGLALLRDGFRLCLSHFSTPFCGNKESPHSIRKVGGTWQPSVIRGARRIIMKMHSWGSTLRSLRPLRLKSFHRKVR